MTPGARKPQILLVWALLPAAFASMPALAEDGSLAKIRDYRVQPGKAKRTVDVSSQRLSEVVNAFPVRRGSVLHGSIYQFHRNDNLDARNFFDPVGQPLPEYKRNQFGASLALLLGKRLNLLGSYDGLRVNQGSTLLSHVPTPFMKSGDFSRLLEGSQRVELRDPVTGAPFPGNVIPASRIHPVATRLLSLLPDPNRSDPSRNFVNNQPLVDNRDSATGRIDFQASDTNKLALKYEWQRAGSVRPHPLPAFGLRTRVNGQEIHFSWNQTPSPSFVIDWGLDFEREKVLGLTRIPRSAGLLTSLGIGGVEPADPLEEGYPEFRVSGYRGFGDEESPEGSEINDIALKAAFQYLKQPHTLSLGASVGRIEINNYRSPGLRRGAFSFNGFYTGDSFADFLLGLADSATRLLGTPRRDIRRNHFGLTVADDWKIGPRLTVSFGIGYTYTPPYRSIRDDLSVFRPFGFDPAGDGRLVVLGSSEAPDAGVGASDSRTPIGSDRNDWSPSLGVAFRPFETNWLVVRARYSLVHDPIRSSTFLNYSGRNFPFYYTESAFASAAGPPLPLASPFDNAIPAELAVWDMDPALRNPSHQEWGLSLENQVSEQWSLFGEYEGSKGTGVLRIVPGNIPLPAPGPIQARRPNPAFGVFRFMTGGGSYSGHGLASSAERRFAGGFSTKGGLEYRRTFSDAWELPQNARNLRAERAPGTEPAAQLFLSFMLDLPFGANRRFSLPGRSWIDGLISDWRLSGVAHAHTGYRMTVETAGDVNNDGLAGDRPDRVGPGSIPSSARSVDHWFATEHFTAPGAFSFGNAGRNILVGPGYQNLDLSLIREIRLRTRDRLEIRFEMFNAFNNVNFQPPDTWFGTSSFGQIFGAERAREIEVALKYSF